MDIPEFSSAISYNKNDIVRYQGHTFYCLIDNNGDDPVFLDPHSLISDPVNGWADENHFTWKPSYSSQSDNAPIKEELELGDGYIKAAPKGINSNPIKFRFVLENISDEEAAAVLNFLNEKGGEPFVAKLPFPYEKNFFFVATWNHTFVYKDNNNIVIDLEETFLAKQPKYELTNVVVSYDRCDFDWQYMKDHVLKSNLGLADQGTGFGNKLFVFSAYCPDSGQIEDFIVKCEEIAAALDGVGTFVMPESTFEWLYAPINYTGMIIGYVKIARNQNPTNQSFVRYYQLDGQVQPIVIERYGPAGFAFKESKDTDGFITPQFLAAGLGILSDADYERILNLSKSGGDNNWLTYITLNAGAVTKLQEYLLYYWTIKGWQIDAKILVSFYGAQWVDHFYPRADKVFYSMNKIVNADRNSNNFRALLNPSNRSGIDDVCGSDIGGIKPYSVLQSVDGNLMTDGTLDPLTLQPLADGRVSGFLGPQGGPTKNNTRFLLDVFGNGFGAGSRIKARFNLATELVYSVNFQVYTRNVYNGILGSITDPALQSQSVGGGYIGKIYFGLGGNSFSPLGGTYNYTSNFTFAGGYLQSGAIFKSSQASITPYGGYTITTPSWIGPICLSHRARHYPQSVRQQFYNLEV